MKRTLIYFDNSATTQPFIEVADAVRTFMIEDFYNPSSLYAPSVAVKRSIQQVREQIAKDLRVQKEEVYFTSCGTESNVTAILGVMQRTHGNGHLVTGLAEHASVWETVNRLAQQGCAVDSLATDTNGCVRPEDLERVMRPNTTMVCLMQVNNETGAINDIETLCRVAKQIAPQCVFLCDGVQAYPKYAMPAGVDLYSFSGHKFHAPRGVGVLMARKHVKLPALLTGGGQESGMRSGTENAPAIIGLGVALQRYLHNHDAYMRRMQEVKDTLWNGLKEIPGVHRNGAQDGAPHILSVSFANVQAETLLHALEERQIYVGTGSACSSHKKGGNRILKAMGVSPQWTQGTIRFSFSCMNTKEEAEQVAREVQRALVRIRRFTKR